jgi:hypothetical protein
MATQPRDSSVSGQRGLQENDKSPIMQWVHRAEIDNRIVTKHVEIVPIKGANETKFIRELTTFLEAKGYTVSMADSVSPKTDMRDVSISGKGSTILVHVGHLW